MDCGTVKIGMPCAFMSNKGCSFNGGSCHPIIESCDGCGRIKDFPAGKYCLSFPDPNSKWRVGQCNMATHIKKEANQAPAKALNPLKASKRSTR